MILLLAYLTGVIVCYFTGRMHIKETQKEYTRSQKCVCIMISIIFSWLGALIITCVGIAVGPDGDKPAKW